MVNTEKIVTALKEQETEIISRVANKENVSKLVSISYSNIKMGKVASVSTLPILTCPGCCVGSCGEKCYALKIANLRPSVRKAYARNTAIAKHAMKAYFKAINIAVQNVRFFRFHVSGDIMNSEYFNEMIKTAKKNQHCQFLVFTKKYSIVNEYIESGKTIPENLRVLFSGWTNLQPVNPHNLPETMVYNTESEFNSSWKHCGGNCLNCAVAGSGCWTAKNGDTIAFKMH